MTNAIPPINQQEGADSGAVPRGGLRARLAQFAGLLNIVPRRWRLLVLAFGGLVSGAVQAAFILLLGQMAARLAGDDVEEQALTGLAATDFGTAFAVGVGMIVVLIVTYVVVARLTSHLLADTVHRARSRLMRGFLDAPWDVQSKEQVGELQEVLTGHVTQIALSLNAIALIVSGLASLVALLAGAAFLSVVGAVSIILLGVPLALVLKPGLRQISRYARQRSNATISLARTAAETVDLARDIRIFGVRSAYADHVEDRIEAVTDPLRQGQWFRILMPQVFQLSIFAMMLAGMGLVWAFDFSDTRVLAIVVVIMLRAALYGREIQRALVGLTDVRPFIVEYENRLASFKRQAITAGDQVLDRIETIKLDDVNYTYPGTTQQVFHGLNSEVRRGEMVAIVGPSGSGKSTLLEILLRLRDADGGVLINGVDVRLFDHESWTEKTAYVAQRARMVRGTIAENIRFFRPHISDEAVRKAAVDAHIHTTIEALPDGYETVVGGVEAQLSGGQAQRICIARALAGEPELLVMDEPSSALDSESEREIHRAIAELRGRTTIFISSHRPEMLEGCDQTIDVSG